MLYTTSIFFVCKYLFYNDCSISSLSKLDDYYEIEPYTQYENHCESCDKTFYVKSMYEKHNCKLIQ